MFKTFLFLLAISIIKLYTSVYLYSFYLNSYGLMIFYLGYLLRLTVAKNSHGIFQHIMLLDHYSITVHEVSDSY